jgi:transposase
MFKQRTSGSFMRKKLSKKILGRIAVDRKIIEHLMDGKSVTGIQKILSKGKGFIISIRDRALEFNYIEEIISGEKRYKPGLKKLPPYPESPFGIIESKNEKILDTDKYLESEKKWIAECIEAEWSPQSIFEDLKKPIPRTTFYRYMHRNSFMQKSPLASSPMELVHAPGECLQIDWAKLVDVIDPTTGKKKTISIFIGILGHSRYQMVRVVECLNFSTTVAALQSMFQELGGVPRKVTSDNPKVFVIKASEYEPVLNPGFERFASHYGFTIEALPPADPEKKGKVERSVQYVRRLFESYDFKNYEQESAQVHINKKNELANARKHGTHLQRPIDVFINQEVMTLKPLPTIAFEIETMAHSKVRVDGYVRFENKYYRVHDKFRGGRVLSHWQ